MVATLNSVGGDLPIAAQRSRVCLALYPCHFFDQVSNKSKARPPLALHNAMPMRFQVPQLLSLCGITSIARASSLKSTIGSSKSGLSISTRTLHAASISHKGASAIGLSFSHLYAPSLRVLGGAITMPPLARISTPSAIFD